MHLGVREWHAQFNRQAQWTRAIRLHLFNKISLSQKQTVLEVGSGTGAILQDIASQGSYHLFGLDVNRSFLDYSRQIVPRLHPSQADAHQLPFKARVFDISLCHYLLLWVADPVCVVAEMLRVTKAGGFICLLAEPDYGGRIDYPDSLTRLGILQEQALIRQGAQTHIGRRLNRILLDAGLTEFESGVLGAQWIVPGIEGEQEQEWSMLLADLDDHRAGLDLTELRTNLLAAEKRGERILYVPTFYAWGRVPA